MQPKSLVDFLQYFETSQILDFLRSHQMGELIRNPWFLGAMGLLALIALLMKWRILLATILSVTGFSGLIAYTVQRETSLTGMSNETLVVFVAGGVALVFLVIYLLFIKSD
jgi:hypothetical protein